MTLGRLGNLLPGGYVDEAGGLHRDVELAPLTGREEEMLLDGARLGAALVTDLLCRCVRRIGNVGPLTPEAARDLLVADRQFLLLKIRQATFGSRVQATVACPWRDCGEKADITFSIADLPVREPASRAAWHEADLPPEALLADGSPAGSTVFRLPRGGDQEALAGALAENEGRALRRLLHACLRRLGPLEHPDEDAVDALPPRTCLELEKRMAEAAPQVDLEIGAACPACGRVFQVPFDLHDFFFGEFRASRDFLYREVHYLAYHYHWSESEIMDMPRRNRMRYIELLAEEIDRMNHGQ
jgi:hypothetical protein